MARQRRSRTHHAHKHGENTRKPYATKKRGRDYDQLYAEAADPSAAPPPDEYAVGAGQHYCVECGRYFVDGPTLELHRRSGPHKAQLRRLRRDLPWTTDDARAMGVDNGPSLGSRAPGTAIAASADAAAAVAHRPTGGEVEELVF